jgi:hypothetical protein
MACVNHLDVPEVTHCHRCRRPVCADCYVVLEGQPLCGDCKGRVVRQVERGYSLDLRDRQPSPWERERSFATLVETMRLVLFHPREFYSGLALEAKGYWSYLLAIGWPSTILGGALALAFPMIATFSFGQAATEGDALAGAMVVGLVVLFAPLQIMIATAIQGAIAHLFLRMAGGANARLETSVRTAAYSQSVLVINWIPLLGPVVGGIWGLVLLVIGLKEMHRTTYARVLAAILVPLVLCGGFIFFMFVMAVMVGQGR